MKSIYQRKKQLQKELEKIDRKIRYNKYYYKRRSKGIKNHKDLMQEWSKVIREKNNYTCQFCGKIFEKSKVHAHHIYSVKEHPELKFVIENGICLCEYCHLVRIHQNDELCEAVEESKEIMLNLDWDEIEQWNDSVKV